jgi:predicted nucleotidyltransferase
VLQATEVARERFGLPQAAIDRIAGVLATFPAIERVMLYGSRAKGNYRTGSDIDLAIVGSQFSDEQLVKLETHLDDLLLPYSIDVTRFDSIANPDLIEHIQRVAKTFYERPYRIGNCP